MGVFVNGINGFEECNNEVIRFLDMNDFEYIIEDVPGLLNDLKKCKVIDDRDYDLLSGWDGVKYWNNSYGFEQILDYVNETYPEILKEYAKLNED